jgi:cytochrome c-type biogenesis protein CcmH
MKSVRFAICVAVLFALMVPAAAVQPDEILKDPVAELRARTLSSELRCLVCQNESIDDSTAPLAKDLRLIVRERITAGDTNEQVKTFLVQRYGEFVLLRPLFSARTAVLWASPFLAVLLGGLLIWQSSKRRVAPVVVSELTPDEEEKLAHLLSDQR